MALLATVLELQHRDNDIRAADEDQTAFIARWRTDIDAVHETVRAALAPLKERSLVEFTTIPTTIHEEPFGAYAVDQLAITIVGRVIMVAPTARFTIGGTGRIDMFRDDRPAMEERILLVRGAEEAGHVPEAWMIEDGRELSRAIRKMAVMTARAGLRRGTRFYRALTADAVQDAVEHLLKLA